MKVQDAIKAAGVVPGFLWKAYIEDLTDDDMMVRPVEGANHIKWQIGHILVSQVGLVEAVCPGKMPALPEDFADAYTKETASSDDPSAFDSKEDLIRIADEQAAAINAIVDGLSDEELEKPMPEKFQRFGPDVAHLFAFLPSHWTMHAGQWAIIRRKLGKPPLF
ncbi:MAG: DinB family protein [Planctomycetaceae bacterium]|nr:DinB family protein [Planctomycetaceae bacterium]